MSIFVVLVSFTERGINTIGEGPARLDAARTKFREAGAEIKHFYLTSGRFDAVAIVEAPDFETIARLLLEDARTGTSRSETLFAFSEEQYRDLTDSL